jgi:hypothetical protein
MQIDVTAHAANCSINILNMVFEDRLISRSLWSPVSPDLNPCDLYL